jgi:hypothetical protein
VLAPGASAPFAVIFTPSLLGTREGVLTLLTNDEDESTFTLRLTGRGAIGGEVQFEQATYPVTNLTTHVDLRVIRNGTRPCQLGLSMDDGVASKVPPFVAAIEGYDFSTYEPSVGYSSQIWPITFAEGELFKNFRVQLQIDSQAKHNKRFTVFLYNPTAGATLGPISTTTVEIRAPDSQRPTVSISTPTAGAKVSAAWPFRMTGVVGDAMGIERVEVALNGGSPVLATLATSQSPTSVPFSADISPAPGPNTMVVTAYDLRGNQASATRAFEFERRYQLSLALSSSEAGSVSSVIKPVDTPYPLPPGTASNSAGRVLQVLPSSSVTLSAKAKPGHVFRRWLNLPLIATAQGSTATFASPSADLTVTAEFMPTPFAPVGQSSGFLGLLRAESPAAASVVTEGLLSGTLSREGSFTGRLVINGASQPVSATFLGDGSAWTGAGTNGRDTVSVGNSTLRLIYDLSSDAIIAELMNGGMISRGTASRQTYSATSKVPASVMGGPRSARALYTLRLPVQASGLSPSAYPQGDGLASITVNSSGTVNLTGVLADGTPITGTSAFVLGNATPFCIQISTPGAAATVKGGLWTGTLYFDPTRQYSDVLGDITWFRPSAIGTKVHPYPSGWPQGMHIPAQGAFYNPSQTLDLTLGLMTHSAFLSFDHGRLTTSILKSNLSIRGNVITKTPPQDASFTLRVLTTTGLFSGTFTPNWPKPNPAKPAFKGILIQKGSPLGGSGHFLSNNKDALTPESGRMILGAP